MSLERIVNLNQFPLGDPEFQQRCAATLATAGALVMPEFLLPGAVEQTCREAEAHRDKAFFCTTKHNVYLTPPVPEFSTDHPRNREVISSKGCITDDQVPLDSPLRTLYDAPLFKEFLCAVLGEQGLYRYADPLSSINVHYAEPGQELGWHFDNSSFAITLMLQPPERGGAFEYVGGVRNAETGEMNFDGVEQVLDGKVTAKCLSMEAGALVLFRGRNAMHRVAPVEGASTRMLVVLAYNAEPGISLSESARLTFYGRLN